VLLKIQQVPAAILTRLFKSIDDGYFYRSESRGPVRVDVRLLGTTDRDLEEEVRLGRFPSEVWARLQASCLRVPPLRDRPGDVVLLASDELDG